MKILAIDPGKTTGWFYTPGKTAAKEDCEFGHTLNYSSDEKLEAVFGLLSFRDILVIERPPQRGNDSKLVLLYNTFLNKAELSGIKTLSIYPGLWKPWVDKFVQPKARLVSTKFRHARDAEGMTLFFIKTKL